MILTNLLNPTSCCWHNCCASVGIDGIDSTNEMFLRGVLWFCVSFQSGVHVELEVGHVRSTYHRCMKIPSKKLFFSVTGGFPYPSVSNHELLAFLQEGNRMAKPDNITPELYELMQTCWKPNPDDRPSFREIRTFLEPHRQIYIDFNEIEPSYVFPPTAEQSRQTMANNKS